ncbi:hypothetical protein AUP68_04124 [Ilyonectria robusta]
MQHARDSESSTSTPANTSEYFPICLRAYIRQQDEEQARKEGDDNGIWMSIGSSACWALDMGFSLSQRPGDAYAEQLHDQWYRYYQASKNTSASSAAQDRLAFQVVQIQARGTLSRSTAGGDSEMAVTSDGTIWTDLPFFASDMTDIWIKECAGMSATHRTNFSCFLSKLASVGLAKEKLCGVALVVFRDALETPRPLDNLNSNCDENPDKVTADLSIADFLPAVGHWLGQAGTKMIELSEVSWQDCTEEAMAIGILYRDDASTTVKSAGFSSERWIYWLRRLEEITEEANKIGNEKLAEATTGLMDTMFLTLNQTHSTVRSEFEASPGVVKYRNPFIERFMSEM